MNGLLYLTIFCFVLLAPASQAADNSDLLVRYLYQGNEYKVKGLRTDRGYVFGAANNAKSVLVSTLDWPPYIAEHMCMQGWVQQLTVALFNSQGYTVKSQFRPWARAVQEVESGEADVLYPEYHISATAPSDVFPNTLRLDHLALSDGFPGGIVALIKRKDASFSYHGDLKALKGKLIGVVRGYENTPAFDAMMDQGLFRVGQAG